MVFDKVKVRGIIPISIVLTIFIIVSSIFSSVYTGISIPSNLKVVISPPRYLEVGETARTFIIQIMDQNSVPVSNLEIIIIVLNLFIYMNNDAINCDFTYLTQNYWNYFFIRNLGLCTIKTSGHIQSTDNNGYAFFKEYCFEDSPQGSYYLAFKENNSEVIFSSFNIILAPSALMVKMLSNPPKTAKVNSPLEIQPQLIVYDKYGIPLPNTTVSAASWPYGDNMLIYPQIFDPDVDKFALIGGSKSVASNKDGYANFTNLTILGSTHENVYIIFIPEGNQIIVPWIEATFPNVFISLE